MDDCIFCTIGQGQTDTLQLYTDKECFVIRDIYPAAPTHLLIIPHDHITSLAIDSSVIESVMGHLVIVAHKMAHLEGVQESGYRLVLNQGQDSGQAIAHLHLHLLAGKQLPSLG